MTTDFKAPFDVRAGVFANATTPYLVEDSDGRVVLRATEEEARFVADALNHRARLYSLLSRWVEWYSRAAVGQPAALNAESWEELKALRTGTEPTVTRPPSNPLTSNVPDDQLEARLLVVRSSIKSGIVAQSQVQGEQAEYSIEAGIWTLQQEEDELERRIQKRRDLGRNR
jgi:hypothetical protein